MKILEAIIVFVAGSCIGSFLNVCIFRLPREMSIVFPFSFCPNCKTPLKWHDNIPLVGYLWLCGKCRSCRQKISFRYFLVEFLTAALFVLTYLRFGLHVEFFKIILLFSFCIVVSFIDIDFRAIPAYLCVLGILAAVSIAFIQSGVLFYETLFMHTDFYQIPLVDSLLGIFIGLGFVYFFKLIGDFGLELYLLFRKKDSIEGERESLGLGDVDFIGMVGGFLGWKIALLVFFLAPVISLLFGVYILIRKKSHLIAYLPFLSIGVVVAVFFGEQIINLFFR